MVANVFDAAFYAAKNQDLGRAGLTTEAQLTQHFQQFGLAEGRAFSPYVDLKFYASCNPDLAAAGITSNTQLYNHLTNFGVREKRVISPFVDLAFYDANNPDLAAAGLTNGEQIFDHLRQFGIKEERILSRNFSADVYFSENQDVAIAFNGDVEQGFRHLQLFGLDEGRRFASNFDASVYATTNTDLGAAGITSTRDLLAHYIKFGRGEGRQGANVIIGGFGDILEGTSRQDTFRLIGAGATINNFSLTGNNFDRIELFTAEPITFLDGVSRFLPLIQNIDGGVRLLSPTPDGSATLTNNLATITGAGVTANALSNTPEAFRFASAGNVVTEWNELTFDAARIAGVPPAASTRYFAIVQTAINDAVQGILNNPNRNTYLQSIGKALPTLAAGIDRNDAIASIAAAAAAERALNRLFTDPDSPVIFNFPAGGAPTARTFTPIADGVGTAQEIRTYFPRIFADALEDTISRFSGVGQAAIAAARAFGESIGQAIIDERANDGAFRDAAGQRVNPGALATEYLDGIESSENLYEVGGQDQQGANAPQRDASGGSLLNDGTVGRKSDGSNYIGTGAAIKTRDSSGNVVINGTAATTPGAWRRGEDTLQANGQFAGLASIEVADINKAWVLPSTNFFNDNVLPPPALDSDRYRNDVAEIYSEGSILDLPQYGTNTQISVNNRTTTVNGETTFATGALGAAINDTNASDNPLINTGARAYRGNDFGSTGTDGIGRTSEERTIIGHVWANAEGSYGPNYAWQKVAQQLAINNRSSLADTAYVFAAMDTALADGFINIWDIKWDEDYFWRPVSSVRNADELPLTAGIDDNSWTPREVTPQHPCHPSGTSMTAGVASTILAEFYGNNQTFTVSADPHPNSARLAGALTSLNGNAQLGNTNLERVTRKYTSLSQAADESRISRLYAGAHFRFATENGVNMGEQVARYFLRHNPFVKSGTMTVPMGTP